MRVLILRMTTENGTAAYFVKSGTYCRLVDEYALKYPQRDVEFLIDFDEPQSPSSFSDEQYIFATGEAIGLNHYLENFAELLQCDVILTLPGAVSVCVAFPSNIPAVLHS